MAKQKLRVMMLGGLNEIGKNMTAFEYEDDIIVVDLPGIYSLSPYTLEEVVARNFLVGERPDVILNIVDGTNLERNLYLTTQLIELGIPVVIAINMMDIVNKRGDRIDKEKLSKELGCQVVEISALKETGLTEAADAAIVAANMILLGSINSGLYAIIMIFVSTRVIDSLIYGTGNGKMLMIVTKKPDEVSKAIVSSSRRGVSVLPAKGAYTGEDKGILICVVRKAEVSGIIKTVKATDSNTFIIVSEANEILGEGFKHSI